MFKFSGLLCVFCTKVKFHFPVKHCSCCFSSASSSSRPHPRSKKTASSQTHRSCPARCPWQTNWRDAEIWTKSSTFAMQRCLYRGRTPRSSTVSLHHCNDNCNAHFCNLNHRITAVKTPSPFNMFLFFFKELNRESVDATKKPGRVEVLVPNTCELDTSQTSSKLKTVDTIYFMSYLINLIDFCKYI